MPTSELHPHQEGIAVEVVAVVTGLFVRVAVAVVSLVPVVVVETFWKETIDQIVRVILVEAVVMTSLTVTVVALVTVVLIVVRVPKGMKLVFEPVVLVFTVVEAVVLAPFGQSVIFVKLEAVLDPKRLYALVTMIVATL